MRFLFRFLEGFVYPPLQVPAFLPEPCQFVRLAPLAADDFLQGGKLALQFFDFLALIVDDARQFV